MSNAAVTLRPVGGEDEPFLRALFCEVHAPGLAPLQLAPEALQPLLEMQFRGQTATYAARFPERSGFVVEQAGVPVGRLLLGKTEEALHLLDLGLLPAVRGQGIGGSLLDWLAALPEAAHLPLRLQVRPGNPAVRLYERHGFVATGDDGVNRAMERPVSGALELTAASFRSLMGQTLRAYGPGGVMAPLTLRVVEPLRDSAGSFAIEFTGPLQAHLPSATVRLLTPDRRMADVFLSPVAAGEEEVQYEAVFHPSGFAT